MSSKGAERGPLSQSWKLTLDIVELQTKSNKIRSLLVLMKVFFFINLARVAKSFFKFLKGCSQKESLGNRAIQRKFLNQNMLNTNMRI